VMMIAVIGGRIVPSFTRNWLVKAGRDARPAPPMRRLDKLVLLVSIAVLLAWVLWPATPATGAGLIGMGLLHLARQARWQPHRTLREPLLFVLHAAYIFVPAGALALGLDLAAGLAGPAAAQHLWMTGAMGAMILAVMTRASLGHTGQALTANRATVAIYLCIFGAAILRFAAAAHVGLSHLSGLLWIAAFAGFVAAYGPALLRPKPGA